MASVLRTGISKLRIGSTGLCKVSPTNNVSFIQVSWISSREVRKNRPPRPAPFPYTKKRYNVWEQLFDDTIERFDDNTKFIIVEGPPAMGKGDLCKKLAEELDMLYVPQTYLNDYYVRWHDFDLKTVDKYLPESCKTCDVPDFLKNPTVLNGAKVQFLFYLLRYQKTMQILTHILSTGQGVVTERSPWSDQCFANTMNSNGYLSDKALKMYNDAVKESLHELMRPHLVIYLDASVSVVQEKIKKRNNPDEVNSKVLNEKFLADLEYNYKFDFLKKMNQHSHILIYDFSKGGDFEVIVEDLETLDFDSVKEKKKFEDWDLRTAIQWTDKRRMYCEEEHRLLDFAQPEDTIAEECRIPTKDALEYDQLIRKHAPRRVWDDGFIMLNHNPLIKKFLEPVN